MLRKNHKKRIGTGSSHLNVELSLNRVKSVKSYLVDKGVSEARLQTKGYRSSKPVSSNLSEETRKLN